MGRELRTEHVGLLGVARAWILLRSAVARVRFRRAGTGFTLGRARRIRFFGRTGAYVRSCCRPDRRLRDRRGAMLLEERLPKAPQCDAAECLTDAASADMPQRRKACEYAREDLAG